MTCLVYSYFGMVCSEKVLLYIAYSCIIHGDIGMGLQWKLKVILILIHLDFDKAEILTTKSRVYEITFFYRDSMKLYLFCNFFWYKHQRHPYNAIYMSKWIYLVPTWKSIFPNHLWHAYKRSPDLDYQSEFV